jgi:hypothetical protein
MEVRVKVKRNYLILLIVTAILMLGYAPSPEIKATPVAKIIEAEAQGVVVHYQGELFWSEDEWLRISESKEELESDLIQRFIDDVSTYGEGNEHVVSSDVRFNKERKSTTLKCDIHGAISKKGERYQATFFWLLGPLGLDFIDDNFKESEEGLFWQGLANGIPTTVTVRLPAIDGSVYKAWHHPVGHCHAHVWWSVSS